MKCICTIFFAIAALAGFQSQVSANVQLGTAGNFGVLAGSTVTNTGSTTITGNLGVYPGSAITGTGTITLTGTVHAGDAVAQAAQSDLTTAYNQAAGLTSTQNLTGMDLGGLTLTPGVYTFNSSAQLTGILTLDSQGNPNAQFVFQIGSTLTTASNAIVNEIDLGTNPMPGCNVFWQVGSSATLGTGTAFEGNILAESSITLNAGATIVYGSALAQTGAVTLDTNIITFCPASTGTSTATATSTGTSTSTATATATSTSTATATATSTSTATGTIILTSTSTATSTATAGLGVPEPTSVGLWGLLGLTLAALRRWKKVRA